MVDLLLFCLVVGIGAMAIVFAWGVVLICCLVFWLFCLVVWWCCCFAVALLPWLLSAV